ncbi:MAG: hypothetical protein ACYCYR_14160, partial [Desulfobulbaceae bacterium]
AAIWANFSHDGRYNQPAASVQAAEGGQNATFITGYTSNRELLVSPARKPVKRITGCGCSLQLKSCRKTGWPS